MDLKTTEKKIRETEAAIRRDLSEISKVDGTIRRSQERKKVLENRVKDNRALLSDLENRKTQTGKSKVRRYFYPTDKR